MAMGGNIEGAAYAAAGASSATVVEACLALISISSAWWLGS